MYVIQERIHEWQKWETYGSRRYETLAEARAALKSMPLNQCMRITEEYTVTRYKAVKLD